MTAMDGTRDGPEGWGVLGGCVPGGMLEPTPGGDGRGRGRGKSPGGGSGQGTGLVPPLLPCSGGRAGLRHGGSGACGERDRSPSHLSLGRVFLSLIVNRFD